MSNTTPPPDSGSTTVEPLTGENWARWVGQIESLEGSAYEPARRDSIDFLAAIAAMPRSACLLARNGERVTGFCFGGPLEAFGEVQGVATDSRFGLGDTLYAADLTVAASARGRGLARRLKQGQLERACSLGYRFYAGRNRVGLADAMWHINRYFGARQVQYFEDGYDDAVEPRGCIYYHIDLGRTGGGPGA